MGKHHFLFVTFVTFEVPKFLFFPSLPFAPFFEQVARSMKTEMESFAKVDGSDSPTPKGKKRYVTALLCLWVTTICYADRTFDLLPELCVAELEKKKCVSADRMRSVSHGCVCV